MSQFLDGPAAGVTLGLKRAPKLLRAVQSADGWDALDQLDDEPKADERIVVYRLEGEPMVVHINRGRKGGCGWLRIGQYRVVDPQPSDDVVRSTAAWRAWALENCKNWNQTPPASDQHP